MNVPDKRSLLLLCSEGDIERSIGFGGVWITTNTFINVVLYYTLVYKILSCG